VYREQVAVPLLVKLPGSAHAGLGIEAPVESVDVAPTLLRLLGLEGALEADGRVILPEALEGAVRPRFTQAMGAGLLAVQEGRHKLVVARPGSEGVPERPVELFDLAEDPGEARNLAAANPSLVERLRAQLAEHLQALPAKPQLTPEQEERLRALGYVR
jgi:arylsulfatase A-like enzyme